MPPDPVLPDRSNFVCAACRGLGWFWVKGTPFADKKPCTYCDGTGRAALDEERAR